jgi:hypothetical protein
VKEEPLDRWPGWRASWHRLLANMFEAFLAAVALLTAALFFLQPHDLSLSPIARAFPWAIVWNAGYALAGVLTLTGLISFRRDVEIAGLMFLTGSILVQVMALLVVRGRGSVLSVSVDLAFASSCVGRVWALLRGRDVLVLAHPDIFYG